MQWNSASSIIPMMFASLLYINRRKNVLQRNAVEMIHIIVFIIVFVNATAIGWVWLNRPGSLARSFERESTKDQQRLDELQGLKLLEEFTQVQLYPELELREG